MVRLRMKKRMEERMLGIRAVAAFIGFKTYRKVPGMSSLFHFPFSLAKFPRGWGIYQIDQMDVGMLIVS